jgi:HAD superfamily hydrolase (TIGR01509 family)
MPAPTPLDLIPVTTDFPDAVLWDMDGTLVDTEPYWMQAEIDLVAGFGGVWTYEDGLQLVGNGLVNSAVILQKAGVALEVDDIIGRLTESVQEKIRVNGVPWRPGARELLAQLSEHKVRAALVTMSISTMAAQIVELIGFDVFELVIAGDNVENPKPHPEPYLLAAARLGVPIERCVAFEDSVPGVASACASGAVTIAVPHIVTLPEDPGYTVWPTLADKTIADIATVFVEAAQNSEVVTP